MSETMQVPTVQVPSPDVDWPGMLEFALTYDGYERIGALNRLAALARPILKRIETSGSVPEDVGLDMLRAVLFYGQRVSHHSDD